MQNGIEHPWRYTDFTEEAGLTGAFILDLTFDAAGNLWVASADGVARFDGVLWSRFGTEHGLPSEFVRSIWADSQGRVWVGTDRGIAIGNVDGFRQMAVQPAASNIRRIRAAPNGDIWICADSWLNPQQAGGLAIAATDSLYNVAVPDDYVSDVEFMPDGRTALLTAGGVYLRMAEDWELLGNSDELGYPRDFVMTASGDLLLATDQGVFRLEGRRFIDASEGLWRPGFTSFLRLSDGSIYMVERGVGALKRWTGTRWVADGSMEFESTIFESAKEAPDGSVWFAGMSQLGRFGPAVDWIEHPTMTGAPFEDTAGRLWFSDQRGTWTGTHDDWTLADPDSHRVVSRQPGVTWLWSEAHIHRYDAEGRLLAFDARELGVDRIEHFDAARSGYATAVGPIGDTWALARWDMDQGWRTLSSDLGLPGIADVAAAGNSSWVAGITPPAESGTVLQFDGNQASESVAPAVTSLTQLTFLEAENPPLLAGDFGVARFDGTQWNRLEDLPARSIVGWHRGRNHTWIAHGSAYGGESGITMIGSDGATMHPMAPVRLLHPYVMYGDETEVAIVDTTARGVVMLVDSPVTNPTGGLQDRNGDYWISAPGTVFHLPFDPTEPETWLEVQSNRVALGQDLVATVFSRLPWRSADEKHRQFSWRIDGGPWSLYEWSPSLRIPTENLDTGVHLLEVRSRSRFGVEDPSPARLGFNVVPIPLQARPWFWPIVVLTFLVVLGTSIFALRSRRQIRRLNTALEDRVRKRTLALEETRTRLAAIVLASPAPIMVLDADTTVEVCNPAGADLMGLPTDAIIGRRLADFVDPNSGDRLQEMVDDVLGGRPIRDKLLSPKLPDGREVHIAASAVTLSPALEDIGKALWIGIEITDRVRAQEQLQRVSLELQRVQELERRRLAQDLHDDVGGSLTTLKMAFLTDLHAGRPPEKETLQERVNMVQELMNTIRTVSLMLRPATLDDFGLSAAVSTLVNRMADVYPGRVEFTDELDPGRRLQDDVQTAAYRIAQECLTNAVRHSGAGRIHVKLWKEPGLLKVRVEDTGAGFDASILDAPLDSSGLAGMRRRAEVLGGRLSIHSTPDGTRVEAELPLIHVDADPDPDPDQKVLIEQ
ncbi:MAG: PAS domain-containing protein [Rhodothermales bacterium]|nr:PAS domain-containing protein [Rhodothermales bacterium]MBO6781109.1 PAS domain-containing protein [Rhodothermales bacterium]